MVKKGTTITLPCRMCDGKGGTWVGGHGRQIDSDKLGTSAHVHSSLLAAQRAFSSSSEMKIINLI